MEPMDFERERALREEFSTDLEQRKWAMENLTTALVALEERDNKPDLHLDQLMKLNMEVRNLRDAVDRGFASVVKAIWDTSGKRPADADTYELPEKGGE